MSRGSGERAPTAGGGSDGGVALAARGLGVSYPAAERPALVDVYMEVPPGTLYAVLGPNGSGKSTLMRALLGMVPSVGEALVGGSPVREWKRRELATVVGAVPQNETVAFPLTVREMVEMGRYPHLGPLARPGPADREAVTSALTRCDVEHLGDREVGTLSGGELQRVRIARALAQEPRVLALDEPTASLDIRHRMRILELLRGSADAGMTVLLITHDLESAGRFSDRLLLLSEGRVAAEGAPRSVLRSEVLSRVYEWPVDVMDDPATGAPRITPR